MRKTKRISTGKLILFAVVTTIIVTTITLSRYQSTAAGSSSTKVATPVLELSQEEMIEVELSPAMGEKTYVFSVANNNSEKDTEVSMKYNIQIESLSNLPLIYEIYTYQNKIRGEDNLLSGNGNITDYISMYVDKNLTHKYILVIKWDENNTNYNFSQTIEYIKLIINGEQQDDNKDVTKPVLTLEKETYIDIPFDDSWTYGNAEVVEENGEQVLVLAPEGKEREDLYYNNTYIARAVTPFIDVYGETFYYTVDCFTTSEAELITTLPNGGGTLQRISYYDDDEKSIVSNNGYSSNGMAMGIPLNEWTNFDFRTRVFYNKQGSIVKKIRIAFNLKTDGTYSQPITKYKNLKVYGQMENSFYNIKISATDDTGVIQTKYAKGEYGAEYFANNGIEINEDQITVTENGIYTVYVKDTAGNETTKQIEITKITE